jgi:hypothetical protein
MYGFVELDVLAGEDEIGAEEGSDRWGKPHIASLSFHSLIKLRQLIERDGVILLDLEERDMHARTGLSSGRRTDREGNHSTR